MAIHRVTAEWSGFTGAPGYTNFHFSPFTGGGDAQASVDRVRAFFQQLIEVIPTGVSVRVSPTVEVIDETTGSLTGYLDAEPPAVVNAGSGGTIYVGPAGGVINWNTATVRDGRRVRGRTFVVPMRNTAFDGQGTLTAPAIAWLNAAANALRTGDFESGLVVWSRPRNGSGGVAAPVIGHRVPDLAAVLRSRRD